jgi:gluconokinase
MSSSKILIIMGVSGSGKTEIGQRLAQELGWEFFDGDDFHSAENIEKMSQGIPLTDDDRDAWLKSLQELIHHQITVDQPAVIACSALRQTYRDRLQISPSVRFIYLKGDHEVIRQRLKLRTGHYMSADLLDSQFSTLEEPQNALTVDVSQTPDEIVAAIRQTLTDLPIN